MLISSTLFQNYRLLIILLDTKTELTLVMSEYNCTESVPILRCHLLYQNSFVKYNVYNKSGKSQPILIFCLLDVFKFGILVKYVSPVVKISRLFLIFYLQNDQPAIFKANFSYALIWNYKFLSDQKT